MIKKKIEKKDNVISFPSKLSSLEKEIEAVIFAAAEPLDKDTIESKISKRVNVEKSLKKLQKPSKSPESEVINTHIYTYTSEHVANIRTSEHLALAATAAIAADIAADIAVQMAAQVATAAPDGRMFETCSDVRNQH